MNDRLLIKPAQHLFRLVGDAFKGQTGGHEIGEACFLGLVLALQDRQSFHAARESLAATPALAVQAFALTAERLATNLTRFVRDGERSLLLLSAGRLVFGACQLRLGFGRAPSGFGMGTVVMTFPAVVAAKRVLELTQPCGGLVQAVLGQRAFLGETAGLLLGLSQTGRKRRLLGLGAAEVFVEQLQFGLALLRSAFVLVPSLDHIGQPRPQIVEDRGQAFLLVRRPGQSLGQGEERSIRGGRASDTKPGRSDRLPPGRHETLPGSELAAAGEGFAKIDGRAGARKSGGEKVTEPRIAGPHGQRQKGSGGRRAAFDEDEDGAPFLG